MTAVAPTFAEAQRLSRETAEAIEFEGKVFRRDIGWREAARQNAEVATPFRFVPHDVGLRLPLHFPPMPELPEVETIVRDIRPALVGRQLGRVSLSHDDILRGVTRRRLLRDLSGATVHAVSRRAKHAVLDLGAAASGATRG